MAELKEADGLATDDSDEQIVVFEFVDNEEVQNTSVQFLICFLETEEDLTLIN